MRVHPWGGIKISLDMNTRDGCNKHFLFKRCAGQTVVPENITNTENKVYRWRNVITEYFFNTIRYGKIL